MGLKNSRLSSSQSQRRSAMSDADRQSESRNRDNRSSRSSADTDHGSGEQGDNLADNILSTVMSHFVSSSGQADHYLDGFHDYDDEYEEGILYNYRNKFFPKKKHQVEVKPDTKFLDMSTLKEEVLQQTGRSKVNSCYRKSISMLLHKRELGQQGFSHGDCCTIAGRFLPNQMETVMKYNQKAFCGTYSREGNLFVSACQDRFIRVYSTANNEFSKLKVIQARDVGWSVLDTSISPDGNYLIYSSWSNYLHLCSLFSRHTTHDALELFPRMDTSFCVFSLIFSMDNTEILSGANDGDLYIYDRQKHIRSLRIAAHDDDVNAVTFADNSSQIVFSGGDDGLCKVWDRRLLSEEFPRPVGVLAGHMDGITFIDSKGDARHLITNSKDQTIKLWDLRFLSSKEAEQATRREVMKQKWDYRWQPAPRRVLTNRARLTGDSSLMTYRGHSVLHTLIRARFSPAHTTGQSFIYTGDAAGCVIIYDILTGRIVSKLAGQRSCVRDVSWHPYEHKIMSTSWDGSIGLWTHSSGDADSADWDRHYSDSSDEDEDEDFPTCRRVRRSKRLLGRHTHTRPMQPL